MKKAQPRPWFPAQTRNLALACVAVTLCFGPAARGAGSEEKNSGSGSSTLQASNRGSLPQRRSAAERFQSWYTERSYADSAAGDYTAGEDLEVRDVALAALGGLNGAIVAVDSESGRILTMVNQKLALSNGYMPCSTIKLAVGLAALQEGIVEPGAKVWFRGEWFMTMVEGLAISNNVYFDYLGRKLGFDRVRRYARWLGFGEKAGWEIPGEQSGVFPTAESPAGVGRMTTFGDGILVTPLQLAAFTAALANGGTLYYLQHPQSQDQIGNFQPRVKRYLPVAQWLPELEEGMHQAVKRGTGRSARIRGQSVWGKTGTCSQFDRRDEYRQPLRTRLGWFASYNQAEDRKLVVVVMLRGGSGLHGPLAAEIAGKIYSGLSDRNYFSKTYSQSIASKVVALEDCCSP